MTVILAAAVALVACPSGSPPPKRAATGIHDAAVSGRMALVTSIVAAHPEAVNETDDYGFTPLHGLAEEEHPAIAKYLIARGADVNAANEDAITPLHLAQPAMARLLLQRGAKLEARSKDGATPLLNLAAEADREDAMAVLLAAGADVNARQDNGLTALDIAIGREEPRKVALLRRYGAKKGSELR